MNLPYWFLRLLPMWDYICPKCKGEVSKKAHKCSHCGEKFPFPVRVPPKVLKDKKALEDYVHNYVFPRVSARQREYLAQFFTEIFSDGFESGNFNAWTGTTTTTGETATVVTTNPHHGTYHAKFTTDGSSTAEVSKAYKDITGQSILYARAYVMIKTSLPSGGKLYNLVTFRNVATNVAVFSLRVHDDAGTIKWGLRYWDGATAYTVLATSGPSLDTYYCLELYGKVHATLGESTVYVGGASVISVTGKDTDNYGNTDRVEVGETSSSGQIAHEIYVDCVVVADAYIGLEVAVTYISVSGLVSGSGSLLTGKKLTVSGGVSGLGGSLSNKAFVISGLGEGSGSVSLYVGVIQKLVSGLGEGLGSVLRGKKFTIIGSGDGFGWIVVDKGEVLVLKRVRLEDIFA